MLPIEQESSLHPGSESDSSERRMAAGSLVDWIQPSYPSQKQSLVSQGEAGDEQYTSKSRRRSRCPHSDIGARRHAVDRAARVGWCDKRVKLKWGRPQCSQSRFGRATTRAPGANATRRVHNAWRYPAEKGSWRRMSYRTNEQDPVIDTVRLPRLKIMKQARRCTLHWTHCGSVYTCTHNTHTQLSTRIAGTHTSLTKHCSATVQSGGRTTSDESLIS
ncbi:hypothetical protein EVAR_40566_1 [Eumeta japonica]|uniref:Uncharacterized protein n=1 Tax=Eumeta variegata TaxID=151549 RepID=A0A4C1VV71_EUMVA|nr:hypothetical protein EVAR_40566_1 [Eumeta japonica]